MAVWTFLSWMAGVLILAPVTTFVLSKTVFPGDIKVIGNVQILDWLTTLPGFFYLGFTILISTCVMVFRFTGLFLIVKQDVDGIEPGFKHVLQGILPQIKRLFQFSFSVTVVILLALSILTAGLVLIYSFFLSDYDIHFYLEQQPAEWFTALIAAIGWTVIWISVFGVLALRSSLALPAYADGHNTFFKSVKCSWQLSKKKINVLFRHMLVISILYLLATFIPEFLLFQFFKSLTGPISNWFSSLYPLLTTIGLYLLMSQAISAVTGFTSFSFISTILTKFYFERTALNKEAASPPEFSAISDKFSKTISVWLNPVRSAFVLFFILLISYSLSLGFIGNMPDLSDIKIIAHRAGPDVAPENTIEALEASIRRGVEMAEIDIQQTADEVFVVVHDADLKRVAGRPVVVSEVNYADLENIIQGQYDGENRDLRKVATLEEFLERSKERVNLLIEIKNFGLSENFEWQLTDLIKKYEMSGQVMIMSQDINLVNRIRKVAGDIPAGYTSAVRFGDLNSLPVHFLAIRYQALSTRAVNRFKENGRVVYAWTVNSPDNIADVVEMGIDGIITDYPERAKQVLEELEQMSAAERLLLQFHHFLLEKEE